MPTRSMLIVLTFLAACSTTGTYREPAAEQATATILGVSRSVLSGLNPLGESPDIRILAVDGDSLSKSGWSGYPDTVRVVPGVHELSVRGSAVVDGMMGGTVEGTVRAEFAAGKTY